MNVGADGETVTSGKVCPTCRRAFPPETTRCPDDGAELRASGADPLVGTVLAGRFEILARLGQGGMSVVYKGRHSYMNKYVAIKMLRPQLLEDVPTVKRLQQEAQALCQLTHGNIVQVHDFGLAQDGTPFLVMEYVEGRTLADVLDCDGQMDVSRAIDLFLQVCDALAHAHEAGLVHRDLKPSNIMILKDKGGREVAKIVDFGLVKVLPGAIMEGQRLTQTGEFFGTALYMSPEQCMGKTPEVASDIYALGCVMYEALTGCPPFIGDNVLDTMQRHITEAPQRFKDVRRDLIIAPELEAVVAKSMAKDPLQRYQSADEVKADLLGVQGGTVNPAAGRSHGGSPPVATAASAVTGARSKKSLLKKPATAALVAGASLVLVAGGVGAWRYGVARMHKQAAARESEWKKLDAAGQLAYERGDYAEAERQFVLAATAAEYCANKDARVLLSLRKLADVRYVQGKEAEAEELERRSQELRQRIGRRSARNPAAPDAGSTASEDAGVHDEPDRIAKVAQQCHDNGQCDTAERLFQKAIKISEQVYGHDSAETAERLGDLASFYMGLGEPERAEPLLAEVMSIKSKVRSTAGN